jgi:hypothetical protein
MKRLTFSFSILILTFIWIYHTAASYNPPVNSMIGDISYVKKFGHLPAPGADENERIKTHLEYAEMLLRRTETSYLDSETQLKRRKLLDHLHDYWVAGIFPKNYERKDERSPCFIDKDGNICAVGYLVEKSAGRHVAENINKEFQYSEIAVMNSSALNNWIALNGITKEEAAIIQPSYGWEPSPTAQTKNNISASYGISSAILGGINISANALQLSNKKSNLIISKIGLVSGAAQAGLGLASFPRKIKNAEGQGSVNESKKVLSMINIGIGTGTMLLSSWNLISNKTPKEKLVSWDLQSFPVSEKETAIALSIKRNF